MTGQTQSSVLRRRAALLVLAGLALWLGLSGGAAQAAGPVGELQVKVGSRIAPIPPSFLGLSVETNELTLYEQHMPEFASLIDSLRPPRTTAPVLVRVGGESADSSFWQPDFQTDVAATYQQGHPILLDQTWMDTLASLIRLAHINVILDLNLAAHSPKMAAQVAAAAASTLPSNGLSSFEIGNEPDLYSRALIGFTHATPDPRFDWSRTFDAHNYVSLFGAYTKAITRAVPSARFTAPSTMSRSPKWVKTLLHSRPGRKVQQITTHNYPPFEGCAFPGQPMYPTPHKYMSDKVSRGVARSQRFVIDAAANAGLSVRLTEIGSSVCGGVPGATDTFATSLWIPDMLFNFLSVGVKGVNVHLRGNGFTNTALNITSSGIYAEPLFYGMAMFARAVGRHAVLRGVIRGGGSPLLKVWAVQLGDGSVRMLYVNKSSRDTYVRLRADTTARAQLERLSAPSLAANGTVTLAGQRLGSDGLWHGRKRIRAVHAHAGFYRVLVPAYSAALLLIP